jgi:hypothetical protein
MPLLGLPRAGQLSNSASDPAVAARPQARKLAIGDALSAVRRDRGVRAAARRDSVDVGQLDGLEKPRLTGLFFGGRCWARTSDLLLVRRAAGTSGQSYPADNGFVNTDKPNSACPIHAGSGEYLPKTCQRKGHPQPCAVGLPPALDGDRERGRGGVGARVARGVGHAGSAGPEGASGARGACDRQRAVPVVLVTDKALDAAERPDTAALASRHPWHRRYPWQRRYRWHS